MFPTTILPENSDTLHEPGAVSSHVVHDRRARMATDLVLLFRFAQQDDGYVGIEFFQRLALSPARPSPTFKRTVGAEDTGETVCSGRK